MIHGFCLRYSEDYLAAMQDKLQQRKEAAVALQSWYTISLAQQQFGKNKVNNVRKGWWINHLI